MEFNKEKGGIKHSANPVTSDVTIYYVGETKEEITTEEFQKFIDGPAGPVIGLNELMNICKPIDVSLMND